MPERDEGVPKNDGDQSGEDGAESKIDAIRSGTSGDPYGRGRKEIFGNNEEAAQGPASCCTALREIK
jgi:hypothetical protein